MAKKPSKSMNLSINAVALEDELSSITLNVPQEAIVVTALDDTGPRRVVGNYDWNLDVNGFWDPASGQGDATIVGMIGNAGVASAFDPTGATAGANDPNYDGTVVLESYSISGATGGAITYTATFQGNSALTRAVA